MADPAAVRLVEEGAEKGFEGSSLSNAYTYGPVMQTYPNGNTVSGSLLAAQTPVGVAVWALGANAAQGGAGSIAAVNEAAVTVANWGSAIPTTVDDSDVRAAEACAGPPSGNV